MSAEAAPNHRTVGQQLGLFATSPDIGPGLPLWLPRGTAIRDEIEKLAREMEFAAGFERVCTPHIARTDLYRRSGHLPYFEDDMFPVMEVEEQAEPAAAAHKDSYVLRPMNCPHHHQVFAAQPRSYRDLPLRLAEYGQVYRWERSGALTGLRRVRGMCMNDGHIYCTPEQVADEIESVLAMHSEAYRLLGIEQVRFRLSRRDAIDPRNKYVDDDAAWRWSEALLEQVLRSHGVDYFDGPGHAAFYGPKLDVQVTSPGGVEETLSTVQIDFAQPPRLGLHYTNARGHKSVPLCIHRAPFSTHERLVAILAEIHDGRFPTWLAPEQVTVLPVSEHYTDYAREVLKRLRERFVRATLGASSDTISKRVREAVRRRVPNVLVVGEREKVSRSVSLRQGGQRRVCELSLDDFEHRLHEAIATRARSPWAL